MLEHLEALGLNGYEARAMSHLLRHGERTGPDLSRETGIPFGRVYDTLNALIERGLVTAKPGRPRTFVAAPANAIPGRLMALNKRRIQASERDIEAHGLALEQALTALAPNAAPGSTRYGVRLGVEAAREFLIEATHEAQDRVEAYLAFERLHDDDLQIFEAFRQAVARGVRTRLILRETDIDYLMGTPYVGPVLEAMLPHLGETLQVRLSDEDSMPFSVLDGERVVVGVRDPADPESYFAVVHIEDPAYAKGLRVRFDALWEKADLDRGLLHMVLRKLEADGTRTGTGRLLAGMVRRKASKATAKAKRRA